MMIDPAARDGRADSTRALPAAGSMANVGASGRRNRSPLLQVAAVTRSTSRVRLSTLGRFEVDATLRSVRRRFGILTFATGAFGDVARHWRNAEALGFDTAGSTRVSGRVR